MMHAARFLAVALTTAASAPAARANDVLFLDSFDADDRGGAGYTTVTDLTNWTISGGNIDILNTSGTNWGCSGTCIDLDGTNSGGPVTLTSRQSLRLRTGQVVEARFEIPNATEIEPILLGYANGQVLYETQEYTAFDRPFRAAIRLTAKSAMDVHLIVQLQKPPNNVGPYLDGVTVVDVTGTDETVDW